MHAKVYSTTPVGTHFLLRTKIEHNSTFLAHIDYMNGKIKILTENQKKIKEHLDDGTRSDVVLVLKSADTGLPIVIEFQCTVDSILMKKAIGSCLQAYKIFGTGPIILFAYIESIENSIKEILRKCDDLPCYTASCDLWTDKCYVVNRNSIQDHIIKDSELDPFVAFGLLLTSQVTSVHLAPGNTDPTMNMLYRIYLDVYTKVLGQDIQSVKELKQLNDVYCAQYEKIPRLLKGEFTSKSSIIEYVTQSAQYNKEQLLTMKIECILSRISNEPELKII